MRVGLVILWAVALALPAGAGPEVLWEARPQRPERHAPPARPHPALPAPPPMERVPGPLSRADQRLFDGLRSEGIGLYHEGRYAEAAERFRAALRLKPEDVVTHRWLRATEGHLR